MQKKRLAPQKCYMFTQREWRSMAQISLIQMTSEKPAHFSCKTCIKNCKGASTTWSRGLFQLANTDFPHECTNLCCFFNRLNTKSEKKKKNCEAQRLPQR